MAVKSKPEKDHIAIEDLARTPIQHKEFFVRASIQEGYDGKSRLRIKVQQLKQSHSREKDNLVMKDVLQHRRLEKKPSPRDLELAIFNIDLGGTSVVPAPRQNLTRRNELLVNHKIAEQINDSKV